MPISAAAMEGIQDNGHRWRASIRLGFGPALLGKLNDKRNGGEEVDDAEVERLALKIVENLRSFAKRNPDYSVLERRADNLEMVADCGLEEVNCAMGELYDTFDYCRILVEAPRLPSS